jgi:predicted Zn-dependent protease
MTARSLTHPYRAVAAALLLTLSVSASAQTPITLDKNKYTTAQDVQIGREAAQEVARELPLLNDGGVDEYVESIGRDLVQAIPSQFRHPEFRYTFEVVNQAEINAFALPGGPMFLNRGMIEAAKSEGEVAGVMAHEIAHVALRHGTAQATKAQKFQIGAIAGQILGAIVGGTAGSVIAQGSNFGLGAYFLKYGREYERQADLLGAQILARAGYDPRRMADMFRTIEKQSRGSGGPEWLSSHPNPGDRYEAIQREASMLRIEGSQNSNGEFNAVQNRLRGMPAAYTAEQIARAKANGGRLPGNTGNGRETDYPARTAGGRVAPPSTREQSVRVGNVLTARIPSNWQQIGDNDSVTFAPEGAYYRSDSGQTGFTHGVQMGLIQSEAHDLQQATEELIDSLQRGNPQLRANSNMTRDVIDGRNALSVDLRNVSDVTGRPERVLLSTVSLRDGSLLYLIGVAPQDEASNYTNALRRVKQSIQLTDSR